MVNGMHKFPNSVKLLTHLEMGDMEGSGYFPLFISGKGAFSGEGLGETLRA
jgi:hypothetical protein